MSLQKYKDFLELNIKQLLIKSNPISLGKIMCGVCKKPSMLLAAKSARYFSCWTSQVGASLIQFGLKCDNIPTSVSKKVV